jgi:hypothetical protein
MIITTNTDITAVESGCGHVIYMSDDLIRQRRRDHQTFYCTVCGSHRHWPQKSDLEELRGQLATTKDMLDTARADRDAKERQRRAEKAAKKGDGRTVGITSTDPYTELTNGYQVEEGRGNVDRAVRGRNGPDGR